MRNILFVFVIIFTAFSNGSAEPHSFSLGVIIPLTGPLAEYGAAVRHGFEMASADAPEQWGRVKIIYEDGAYDGAKSLAAFRKLISLNRVDLVYVWGSGPGEVLAPVADSQQVPLVAVAGIPRMSVGRPYVMRLFQSNEEFGEHLSSFAQSSGFKRIAIVMHEIPFFQLTLDGLRKGLPADASVKVVDVHALDDYDYKSTIAKLRTQQFDAIGLFLVSGHISQFLLQAAGQHVKLPILGTDIFESKKEIADSKGLMDGAVFANLNVSDEFRNRYVKAYGDDTQLSYAGHAYDFAMMLAEILSRHSEHLGGVELLDQFKMPKQMGVCGWHEYRDSAATGRYLNFEISLKRVVGADIQVIQPSSGRESQN